MILIVLYRSECERLHIIFEKLIPSILRDEGIIKNKNTILSNHLPKLEKQCYILAGKCKIDNGCSPDCKYCNNEFIHNYFNSISS